VIKWQISAENKSAVYKQTRTLFRTILYFHVEMDFSAYKADLSREDK